MVTDKDTVLIPAEVEIDKINNNVDSSDLKGFKREFDKTMSKAMDAFKISPDAKTFDTSGIQKIASKFYKAMYSAFKIDDKNIITDEDIRNMVLRVKNGLKEALAVQPSEFSNSADTMAKEIETKVSSGIKRGLKGVTVDDNYTFSGIERLKEEIQNLIDLARDKGENGIALNLEEASQKAVILQGQLKDLKDVSDFGTIGQQLKFIDDTGKEIYAISQKITANKKELRNIAIELDKHEDSIKDSEAQIVKLSKDMANEQLRHQRAIQSIELSGGSASAKESKLKYENELHNSNLAKLQEQVNAVKEMIHYQELEINRLKQIEGEEERNKQNMLDERNALKEKLAVQRNILTATKNVVDYNKQGDELQEEIDKNKELLNLEEKKNRERSKSYTQNDRIRELRDEARMIREGTSQFYYRLRAVKMLDHVIKQADASLGRFIQNSIKGVGKTTKLWFKLATPFGLISGAIKKATESLKTFNRESKRATKSHDGFLDSMKHGLWTIIKYTFGIRSLYFLFNKLRHALGTGMENLATQYDHVNQQMSSVVSSLERMKNAVAAMVQPLLNVLAPALEKISELFANLAYNIGSFFAAITGQDFVYYAKKIKKGYIEDKKAAKDYNDEVDRQLSNLDKLNVLTSPKDKKKDEEESPVADMFDVRKISPKALDWLKKLKDFFKPLIDAWNKMKDYVIKSWKYALSQLKRLFKAVWEDFLRVWFEDAQTFFEKIFKIIGNIGLIVGNLARNLLKAWKANDNGYRIFKAISAILIIIADGIMRCTDLMVEWSDELDFVPLFTAIADVLTNQVVPAVQKVVDLFVVLFRDVVLELARYFIEEFAPIIIRAIGNIIEAIGTIASKFQQSWEKNGIGKAIVADVERLLTIIADKILEISRKTKDWAKTLDFEPLLTSAHKLLVKMEPLINWIVDTVGKFWTDVLLPIGKDFIEKKLPKMMDRLREIIGKIDFDKLSKATDSFFTMIKKFWDKYGDVMLDFVTKIADKIVWLINSGTLDKIFQTITGIIDKIPSGFAATVLEFLTVGILNLKILLGILGKITGSLTALGTVINFYRQYKMASALSNISKEIYNIKNGIEATKAAAEAGKAAAEIGKVAESATAAGEAASGAATGMTELGTASVGAAAAVAGVTIGGTLVAKKVMEVQDAAKGGNGAISELGTGLHHFSDILKESGKLTDEQAQSLYASIEQWESWGLNAEQISSKLAVELHNMGVEGDVACDALLQVATQNELTDESYQTLRSTLELLTNTQKENTAATEESAYAARGSITNYDELKSRLEEVKDELGMNEFQFISIRDAMDGAYNSTGSMNDAYNAMVEAADNCGVSIDDLVGKIDSDLPQGVELVAENMKKVSDDAVKTMSNMPNDMEAGFKNGMNESFGADGSKVYDETSGSFIGFLKKIFGLFKIGSPSKVFEEIGKFLIQGLVNGIKAFANSPINAITSVGNAVINRAKSVLSPSKLISIGRNLLSGLANGIRSGVSAAVNAIGNAANSVIEAAKRRFQTHSPSKIFEDIGKMLDEGLAVGVDKNTDDVTDAFDNMVPDNQFLELFYEKFTGMLSSLREESVSIVESMIDEIESAIARMDNLAMLESLSTQLSNISNIKIPDIAVGAKLPDNEKFAQTQTVDLSSLPKMLKSAFIEAFAETSSLQTSDSGDIIIEMNGYELLRAVRDENTKYKKQTGRSAFA